MNQQMLFCSRQVISSLIKRHFNFYHILQESRFSLGALVSLAGGTSTQTYIGVIRQQAVVAFGAFFSGLE